MRTTETGMVSDVYEEYLRNVAKLNGTPESLPVPAGLLPGMRHVPLLAALWFGPLGPVVKTVSILVPFESGEVDSRHGFTGARRDLPHLMIRRDISASGTACQTPIAALSGVGAERREEARTFLSLFIRLNGIALKRDSRPFFHEPPAAISLSPVAAPISGQLATDTRGAFMDFGITVDADSVETWWETVTAPLIVQTMMDATPIAVMQSVLDGGAEPAERHELLEWLFVFRQASGKTADPPEADAVEPEAAGAEPDSVEQACPDDHDLEPGPVEAPAGDKI